MSNQQEVPGASSSLPNNDDELSSSIPIDCTTQGDMNVTSKSSLITWSRTQSSKRPMCERCQRPNPNACICDALPLHRIQLHRTRIIVLQHPKESRRKNRSLPILQLTLHEDSLHVLVGRRLGGSTLPGGRIEEEYTSFQSMLNDTSKRLFLLYPSPDAISLEDAIQMVRSELNVDQENKTTTTMVNLLVLDGTWQYTREMDRANIYPDHMIRIQWTPTETETLSPPRFAIRAPPLPNYLSTAECIAQVVCQLEDNPSLLDELMKPLDWMVTKWKSFQTSGKHPRTKENHALSDSPPSKRKQQQE